MTHDLRGECKDYKPWNACPNPLNTTECFWFIGSTRLCDCPLGRYHRQDCPWEGYPDKKEQT